MNNYEDILCHYGIEGQKWGIRRFQNEDGTLTEEGKKRYNKVVTSFSGGGGSLSEEDLEKMAYSVGGGSLSRKDDILDRLSNDVIDRMTKQTDKFVKKYCSIGRQEIANTLIAAGAGNIGTAVNNINIMVGKKVISALSKTLPSLMKWEFNQASNMLKSLL